MKLNRDYHIHTVYSVCAQESNTPEAILDKLTHLGYESMGFSDHLHPHTDRRNFIRLSERVRKWRAENQQAPQIFMGCEAEVLEDGVLTIEPDFAEGFDYVIVAPNHYHLDWVKKPNCEEATVQECKHHLMRTHITAAGPLADIVAHPFCYGCPRIQEITAELGPDDLLPLIEAAKAHAVTMEVSPTTVFAKHREFMVGFYRMCLENSVKLSVGTDAHHIDKVGAMEAVESFLDELGAEPHHILDLVEADRKR